MRAYRERVGSMTWIVLSNTAGNVAQDLADCLGKHRSELLIDFTHISSISATDGKALGRHLWKAHKRGASIVLGGIRKKSVKRFLESAGFTDYFPWEERIPEAIAHFRNCKRNFLGEMLVREGYLDEDRLEEALSIQEKEERPRRLGWILQEQGYVEQGKLIRMLFRQQMAKIAA